MVRRVSITIIGAKSIERTFWRMGSRSLHMEPVWAMLTRDFRRIMVHQFDSQGAYLNGAPWAPLADSTLERKSRIGADSRIGHETMAMRKSLTTGTGGFRHTTGTSMEIDSAVPYSDAFSKGFTHWKSGTPVPARPLFNFTGPLARRWSGAMQAYIVRNQLRLKGGV